MTEYSAERSSASSILSISSPAIRNGGACPFSRPATIRTSSAGSHLIVIAQLTASASFGSMSFIHRHHVFTQLLPES
jgi:hypothetical protein